MKRRAFLFIASSFGAMSSVHAQRAARVGVLLATPAEGAEGRRFLHEFRQGMAELGQADGRNYRLVVRSYAHENTRLASAAAQLVAARCDVLVSETSAGALALKGRARSVPVVIAAPLDASLNGKLVELAHELLPKAKRLCFVCGPAQAPEPPEVVRLELSGPADLPRLGERLAALQADALIVAADARLFAMREAIMREALAAGPPAVGPAAEFAELGALASYGRDVAGSFRAVASAVDRLLKGAKADELAMAPPSRFELILNLKTARALHLELPRDALLRADRVIE